jgi:hypothetical protein
MVVMVSIAPVIAGLVPAMTIHLAPPRPRYRDGRNTSGHDKPA